MGRGEAAVLHNVIDHYIDDGLYLATVASAKEESLQPLCKLWLHLCGGLPEYCYRKLVKDPQYFTSLSAPVSSACSTLSLFLILRQNHPEIKVRNGELKNSHSRVFVNSFFFFSLLQYYPLWSPCYTLDRQMLFVLSLEVWMPFTNLSPFPPPSSPGQPPLLVSMS